VYTRTVVNIFATDLKFKLVSIAHLKVLIANYIHSMSNMILQIVHIIPKGPSVYAY